MTAVAAAAVDTSRVVRCALRERERERYLGGFYLLRQGTVFGLGMISAITVSSIFEDKSVHFINLRHVLWEGKHCSRRSGQCFFVSAEYKNIAHPHSASTLLQVACEPERTATCSRKMVTMSSQGHELSSQDGASFAATGRRPVFEKIISADSV